jgi:hypothetical protein
VDRRRFTAQPCLGPQTYAVASCPFLLRGGGFAEEMVDDNMAVLLPWSQHNCTVAWG